MDIMVDTICEHSKLIPDYMSALLVWQIHVTLTINMKKNYSIILGIICHRLRKLNQSEHMPKYPFVNFLDPKDKYFLTLSHSCNINYDFEKYSSIILATICQRFRHFNPFVCIPKYPFINFWDSIHNYFFSLTDSCNINYKHEKKLLKITHPWHLSHIYDTLKFKFKCQGWGGGGGVCDRNTPPPPPHPWHLSHIYDTLTFICHIPPPPPPHPWHLSHIYDTLTFKFKCQGWGGGGGYVTEIPPTTTPPLTFKSYLCKGWGGGGGGSIKMGKIFYRIKTESWAQDVGCADINLNTLHNN